MSSFHKFKQISAELGNAMDFVQTLRSFDEAIGVLKGRPFAVDEREIIYGAAFAKYQVGEYGSAADFFTQLVMHDPYDIRFWKGLASSLQMKKEYKGALRAWAIFALLSRHDPAGHFHAAECFLSLDDKEEAKKALALAKTYLNKSDVLHHKIEQLIERLHG